MNKILAFIDLLGFSKMVETDYNKAREILNDFYNISFRIIKRDKKVQGSLFSDSLLAYSDDYPALINCITEIYRECLKKNATYNKGTDFFLLPRGAVSVGYLNIEERHTSPNLTKDFIISPALVHSAKLETTIKGSRLLIAVKSDDEQQVREINWNAKIKSILYDNSSFEFWKGYTYKDALWFLDLSKSDKDQKVEVIKLIDIAIKLVKDNAKKEKVIDQHINTLRIGLLSYTKFLGKENDEVLKKIIREFKADQYWLLWLTVIEIIMNSQEQWKYAALSSIVDFYKKSSLKPGWIKVLEEINKPGQQYLRNSFELFLDEMAIITIDKNEN
ncbi:MAG: hypothetical protein K9H61_14260 [Bacteroidia bacterium]|nr:hypothetical protein [Bacteroidia bacterium]